MSKSNIIFADLAHFRPIMQVILLDIRDLMKYERTNTSQSTPPITFATDIHAARKSAMPLVCTAAEVDVESKTEVEME